MNKTYFTYIIQSEKDGNIYTGISDDPEKRLRQHNAGKNFSTKYRIPFKLICKEEHKTRFEARKREKFLKSGCGREWIKREIIAPIA